MREVFELDKDMLTAAVLENEHRSLELYLEIACNQMLGNPNSDEPWGAQVDMQRQFKLTKCHLELVDPRMRQYFLDMVAIRDVFKALKKQDNQLAYVYQSFAYDMSNEYTMPLTDD